MPETNRLQILQVVAGPIETNLFLVVEKSSSRLLIVDAPPDSLGHAEAEIDALGATPAGLLITHTHWDHIVDAANFKERFSIPVIAHERAKAQLEQPASDAVPSVTPDRQVADGDTVSVGEVNFVVMHTPGHAGDQISIYSEEEQVLFGGDTLFPGGYGRVDLPGASKADTVASLSRLLDLPDDVVVYPGHGLPTTIGRERAWMESIARSGALPG